MKSTRNQYGKIWGNGRERTDSIKSVDPEKKGSFDIVDHEKEDPYQEGLLVTN